jgi:hypothetical protein
VQNLKYHESRTSLRRIHTSQYSKGQTWGALKKAWRGYKVAKVQKSTADMKKYAERIRTLQGELGLTQAKFPELGLN